MPPFLIAVIGIAVAVGMLLWGGALADAVDYEPEAFVAVGRTKRAALAIEAQDSPAIRGGSSPGAVRNFELRGARPEGRPMTDADDPTPAPAPHYKEPGWFTRNVFNRTVAGLTRLGISVWGSRVLEVPGRKTGELRHVPVNLLTFGDHQYLVSPRGEGQWVRNVRANGGRLDLLVGKRRTHWTATEVEGDAKIEIMRAYLKRWKAEVGVFFDGVGPDSSEDELRRIAPKHPVFSLTES